MNKPGGIRVAIYVQHPPRPKGCVEHEADTGTLHRGRNCRHLLRDVCGLSVAQPRARLQGQRTDGQGTGGVADEGHGGPKEGAGPAVARAEARVRGGLSEALLDELCAEPVLFPNMDDLSESKCAQV